MSARRVTGLIALVVVAASIGLWAARCSGAAPTADESALEAPGSADEVRDEPPEEPVRTYDQSTDFPVNGPGWEESQRAQELAGRGRFDEALETIDEAIAIAPRSKFYRMVKTHILGLAGRWEEALEENQAALVRTPGAVIPNEIAYRAMILQRLGREAEALQELERAIEMGPVDGPYHLDRARLLARFGRLDEAIAACDEVIERAPAFEEARRLRSRLVDEARTRDR